jgi:hypothetical protein
MKESIEKLREDYESFKKGNKSVLAVKSRALSVLEIAKKQGDTEAVEEIKDILIDLEFAIGENQCNCHKGNSCC